MKALILRLKSVLSCLTLGLIAIACEDFVQIDPPRTEVISEEVFNLDETAEAAVNGMYSSLLGILTPFDGGLEVYTGILSDELTSLSTLEDFVQFSTNEINSDDPRMFSNFWQNPFKSIFRANSIIEGLENNQAITPLLSDQLLGEALFIRAFIHFYLVNLFGDIPYVTTTDVDVNTSASREPVSQVYAKIIDDLLIAKDLLSEDFAFVNTNERIRPNRAAATLLLARVYLYTEAWANAIAQASELIDDPLFLLEPDLDDVFLATSREAIWQLVPQSLLTKNDTRLGNAFVINFVSPGAIPSTSFPQTIISDTLLSTFEPGDIRRTQWVGLGRGTYNFPNKYKNNIYVSLRDQEYTALLRLAEAYFIRAESNAQLGNLSEAIADVDQIRTRAQLDLIQDTNPGISQSDLLDVIYHEKRVEFFAEGHRWFDLKRTNRVDQVLSILKEEWQPTDVLLPIPEDELLTNSNLAPQNPGY